MNVLLLYPEYPDTFWSFKYALNFIAKKAGYPPLGLLTVASMLPKEWDRRLIDMNVDKLKDRDILWADMVFISAMSVQRESVHTVIEYCKKHKKTIVAGGPLFTMDYESFPDIDHFVLNEAEINLYPFLDDLEKGTPNKIYKIDEWADITKTPAPSWNLINPEDYASMNIQYSRGCPFNCEFCDIVNLYGRIPRVKDVNQIIDELDSLYITGWRGGVFFVDDNFIGNKKKLKNDLLPAIINWMEHHKYPFAFTTEASVDISDDDELLDLMVKAGFSTVFLGIETPSEDALEECGKLQNKNRDLVACIKKIQNKGMQVQGGFIVGFDSDSPGIFEKVSQFIQESGIIVAMVGLLNAPKGTRLYKRLVNEKRLLKDMSGDNTDYSINFIPKMDYNVLINGYKDILSNIYSPKQYYERVLEFLKIYDPLPKKAYRFHIRYFYALIKSIVFLGAFGKGRIYYWRLFFWSLFKKPGLFPAAITFSIYGYHFRKVFEKKFPKAENT